MLLSLRNISKHFPVQRGLMGNPTSFLKAINDVSLDIDGSEIIGIVGESGCGKSTLGKCAVGLQSITKGQVLWSGGDLATMQNLEKRRIRRRYQMVFQNPFASLDPRQRVKDVLLEPMEVHGLLSSVDRTAFAKDFLERVGLSADDLEKYPHEFSGGQRQRIGIARAFVCQPDLVVLDEPVSSLDVSVQASILNLLVQFNKTQKIAYLFISHDIQVVSYLSNRVMVMYLGRIVEEGKVEQVLQKPRHPYTRALLSASEGEKVPVQGEPPSPVNVPMGCAFHTRCPFAEKRCGEEKQGLMEVEGNWKVACWKWREF